MCRTPIGIVYRFPSSPLKSSFLMHITHGVASIEGAARVDVGRGTSSTQQHEVLVLVKPREESMPSFGKVSVQSQKGDPTYRSAMDSADRNRTIYDI